MQKLMFIMGKVIGVFTDGLIKLFTALGLVASIAVVAIVLLSAVGPHV